MTTQPQDQHDPPTAATNAASIRACAARLRDAALRDALDEVRDDAAINQLARTCPLLHRACCDPAFDLSILEFMLDRMDSVVSSGEAHVDATKRVMARLGERYVVPLMESVAGRKDADGTDLQGCGKA